MLEFEDHHHHHHQHHPDSEILVDFARPLSVVYDCGVRFHTVPKTFIDFLLFTAKIKNGIEESNGHHLLHSQHLYNLDLHRDVPPVQNKHMWRTPRAAQFCAKQVHNILVESQ